MVGADATNCEFPHLTRGKGKIVFTNEHLEEIAHLHEVRPPSAATSGGPSARERSDGKRRTAAC